MSNLSGRIRRVDMLLFKARELVSGPKFWHVLCEAGREIPNEIASQFGPHDEVLIEEYQAGYFGEDESEAACVVVSMRPLAEVMK